MGLGDVNGKHGAEFSNRITTGLYDDVMITGFDAWAIPPILGAKNYATKTVHYPGDNTHQASNLIDTYTVQVTSPEELGYCRSTLMFDPTLSIDQLRSLPNRSRNR